ncbi:hypothetical protein GGR56DRAFT_140637 [Xylariaceae sp. FL0804]|nr:hypothetical protein GGR56DRAFT_140637 [Xylariaceae sp. FL0804]
MGDQNHGEMDVLFAQNIWEQLAIQKDSMNAMLRLSRSNYELLGSDGRDYLIRTAQETLRAADIEFFADDENPNRVTLASRAHIQTRGYEVLNLYTSDLPTLTLALGPPLVPMRGSQPPMAGPSALPPGE